jgi:hypothetical protein
MSARSSVHAAKKTHAAVTTDGAEHKAPNSAQMAIMS